VQTSLRKLYRKIFPRDKGASWREIEYFDKKWKERIGSMASHVPAGSTVMDLGCGKMWLREFLHGGTYLPVDYVSRGKDTIVCDFNKKEFPEAWADVVFVSGCLEYMEDYRWFVGRISGSCRRCVISYCTTEEYPNLPQRRVATWVNDLSGADVIGVFLAHGMALTSKSVINKNTIFVFDSVPPATA
jgi:hypothetical protein